MKILFVIDRDPELAAIHASDEEAGTDPMFHDRRDAR